MRSALHAVGMMLGSAVLVGASQAQAAVNLLTENPSFESGSGGPYLGGPTTSDEIPGWHVVIVDGGYAGVATDGVPGKDGNNLAYNGAASFQTRDVNRASVVEGTSYEVSILADADFGSDNTHPVLNIEWFDSATGYTLLGSSSQTLTVLSDPPGDATEGFYAFSFTATAPAGAMFAGVSFSTITAGADPVFAQSTRLDGASLTAVVPEPASLALVGLCGAGLLARRRRAKHV